MTIFISITASGLFLLLSCITDPDPWITFPRRRRSPPRTSPGEEETGGEWGEEDQEERTERTK